MKAFLLSLLLVAAAGCSKSSDPAPTPPVAQPSGPVVFITATGAGMPVSSYAAYSVTATPTAQARRAVVVRTVLAGGETIDVTYTYVGRALPSAGTITLDEPPLVDHYGGGVTASSYRATAVTQGTLTVENTQPVTVSGTYTGPMSSGSGNVKLTFTKLAF